MNQGDIECPKGSVLRPRTEDRRHALFDRRLSVHHLAADSRESSIRRVHLRRGLVVIVVEVFSHRDDDASNDLLVTAVTHILGLRHKTGHGNSDHDYGESHSGSLHCISSCIVPGARLSVRRETTTMRLVLAGAESLPGTRA